MTSVYTVTRIDTPEYADQTEYVLGVYSTPEKARAAGDRDNGGPLEWKAEGGDWVVDRDGSSYVVIRYTLDE